LTQERGPGGIDECDGLEPLGEQAVVRIVDHKRNVPERKEFGRTRW